MAKTVVDTRRVTLVLQAGEEKRGFAAPKPSLCEIGPAREDAAFLRLMLGTHTARCTP